MIDVGNLIQLFNNVIGWLKSARDEQAQEEEHYRHALLSVYLAANETKAYLAMMKRRKYPDRERERNLSRLWSEAAVELRKVDPDLARRCLLTGDYWADPTAWSEQALGEARITLKELYERARELL